MIFNILSSIITESVFFFFYKLFNFSFYPSNDPYFIFPFSLAVQDSSIVDLVTHSVSELLLISPSSEQCAELLWTHVIPLTIDQKDEETCPLTKKKTKTKTKTSPTLYPSEFISLPCFYFHHLIFESFHNEIFGFTASYCFASSKIDPFTEAFHNTIYLWTLSLLPLAPPFRIYGTNDNSNANYYGEAAKCSSLMEGSISSPLKPFKAAKNGQINVTFHCNDVLFQLVDVFIV